MGIKYIYGVARGPTGLEENVSFLVDSGATYSVIPDTIWRALELEPTREMTFTLADVTRVDRRIYRCYLVLHQGEDYMPVVLGEPGDEALLGVVTLKILGLVFHPFSRTLHSMRAMLA